MKYENSSYVYGTEARKLQCEHLCRSNNDTCPIIVYKARGNSSHKGPRHYSRLEEFLGTDSYENLRGETQSFSKKLDAVKVLFFVALGMFATVFIELL